MRREGYSLCSLYPQHPYFRFKKFPILAGRWGGEYPFKHPTPGKLKYENERNWMLLFE